MKPEYFGRHNPNGIGSEAHPFKGVSMISGYWTDIKHMLDVNADNQGDIMFYYQFNSAVFRFIISGNQVNVESMVKDQAFEDQVSVAKDQANTFKEEVLKYYGLAA